MENNKRKIARAPAISWGMFALIWIIAACSASCREIMNKAMPAIIEYFNMDATTSGLLSTVGSVTGAVFVLFLGSWGDRKGIGYNRSKPQFMLALILLAFTFATGIPVFSSVAFLFGFQFLRFSVALGTEVLDASAAAEWFPKESRGFALCAEHTMYPWGSVLTGFAAAALMRLGDWRTPFLVIPCVAIVFWIIYRALSTKKRYARMISRTKEMGLTPPLTLEEIESHEETSKTAVSREKTSVWTLFKNRNVLAAFIMYSMLMFVYFGFSYWITNYLAFQCGFDSSAAAAYSVVFSITAGFGQLFFGLLSDKIGCKRTVMICCIWLALTYSLMPMMSRGVGWVIVLQLVMGFCMNASYPVLYTIAGSSVRKDQLASALGICDFGCIFGGFAPVVIGFIIKACGGFEARTGFVISIYVFVAFFLVAFLIALLVCHEVSGKRRGRDWALTSYESCGIERAE